MIAEFQMTRFQPTYEELKLAKIQGGDGIYEVSSLPMRN